jgi:hypothetical protein
LLTGCGGRLYTDADAARAAGPRAEHLGVSQPELRVARRPFATLAAVNDLELDEDPPFTSFDEGEHLWVIRYSTSHDAQAAIRGGEIRQVDAAVVAGDDSGVIVQARNLVLAGARAAVDAALARLH